MWTQLSITCLILIVILLTWRIHVLFKRVKVLTMAVEVLGEEVASHAKMVEGVVMYKTQQGVRNRRASGGQD